MIIVCNLTRFHFDYLLLLRRTTVNMEDVGVAVKDDDNIQIEETRHIGDRVFIYQMIVCLLKNPSTLFAPRDPFKGDGKREGVTLSNSGLN